MKSLFISILLLIGATAFASVQFPAGYTKVQESRMEDYKKAVLAALRSNPNATALCQVNFVFNTTQYVEDILVSNNSAQPLLIYNTYYEIDNATMHRLIFTTDASLKQITMVEAEIFQKGEVNQGDLSNPVLVEDYVSKGRWNCTKQY